MTTATTNGVAMVSVRLNAGCDLESGADTFTLTNITTGGHMTLDMNGIDPVRYKGDWENVYALLTNHQDGEVLQMAPAQLRTFRDMVNHANTRRAQMREEAKPIAPAPVIATSMERVESMVGERVAPKIPGGLDHLESRVNRLKGISERLKDVRFYQLEYDIPSGKGIADPCPTLHRVCDRTTLSCWAVMEENLKDPRLTKLMDYWKANGVRVFLVPYAKEGNEIIYRRAMENLDNFLREIHTSLIQTISAADERLRKATAQLDKLEAEGQEVTSKQRETVDAKWQNDVRRNIKTAGERLNFAIASAERFDETDNFRDLLQGVREAIASMAVTFNVVANDRDIKPAPIPAPIN